MRSLFISLMLMLIMVLKAFAGDTSRVILTSTKDNIFIADTVEFLNSSMTEARIFPAKVKAEIPWDQRMVILKIDTVTAVFIVTDVEDRIDKFGRNLRIYSLVDNNGVKSVIVDKNTIYFVEDKGEMMIIKRIKN